MEYTNLPTCPKCGNGFFHWAWHIDHCHLPDVVPVPMPEHIHLTCDRCGYAFMMKTKDAK